LVYICVVFAGFAAIKKRLRGYAWTLLPLILILVSASLFESQVRYFDNDEYEHMHKAWMMLEGTIPLISTSFTHMPLLNWIIAANMLITGESVFIINIARFLIFCFGAGSLYLVYLITRKAYNSNLKGLLSIILVASNLVWIKKGLEIRPDNVMLFFALLAFFFLMKFHESNKIKYLVYFMMSAGFSFLGKQNAAIYFIGLLLGFVVFNAARFRNLKIRYELIAIAILLVFIGIIFIIPLTRELVLKNLSHLIPSAHRFSPKGNLEWIWKTTPAVFILFIVQLLVPNTIFPRLDLDSSKRKLFKYYFFFVSVTCFTFLYLMNRPWLQEMLVMIVFMTFFGVDLLGNVILNTRKKYMLVLQFFVILFIVYAGLKIAVFSPGTFFGDIRTTKTVLELSDPNDLVFDSYGKPIFRHHPLEPKFLMYFAWSFDRYDELKQKPAKFFIKDHYFDYNYPGKFKGWLSRNYVHVKNGVSVIGKNIEFEANQTIDEEFYLPGFYTINKPFIINNKTVNASIYLDSKSYQIINPYPEKTKLVMKYLVDGSIS
jgi:hypothetical protein